MINQHVLPAFRVHRHSVGCSAVNGEEGKRQNFWLWGLLWRQWKFSYLGACWGTLCSWGFTVPSPELLVALDPTGCESLDLSCRKALFYPCPAWPLPCPGAVGCRRLWYPPWAFSIPSQRRSGTFTVFWTVQPPALRVQGECVNWATDVHSGGAGSCRNTYFRGRYCNTGNEFALSQHPDKKSYFLTMFSAFSLFKFSRSFFFKCFPQVS